MANSQECFENIVPDISHGFKREDDIAKDYLRVKLYLMH